MGPQDGTEASNRVNGKPSCNYPTIEIAKVTRWTEILFPVNEGHPVILTQSLSLLRIYRVTMELSTCATYSTLEICDGTLLWLLVKESAFEVPLQFSWSFLVSGL